MRRSWATFILLAALVVTLVILVLIGGAVWAFPQYSENSDLTNCKACHEVFNHDSHQVMVEVPSLGGYDCNTCHRRDIWDEAIRFPQYINESYGGLGLAPIACVGCHGRPADGTGNGTEGWGAGLRQMHFPHDFICTLCHLDADPNVTTLAPESAMPPYYTDPGTGHTNLPSDPCNPPPGYTEDWSPFQATDGIGLDNDGDGLYDQDDSDCSGVVLTPGETSGPGYEPLRVTGHDPVARILSISFGVACATGNNTIEYGALADVSTYDYWDQQCNAGIGGVYDWSYPTSPDDLFFVLVGRTGSVEGSYGTDHLGQERPEDGSSFTCPLPQDLSSRCD